MTAFSSTQQRRAQRAQTLAELLAADNRTSRVSQAEVTDVVGLLLLGLIALSGMGAAFGATRYLVVGGVGTVIGIGLAWIAARWSWPWWTVALAVAVVFVLGGSWLVDPVRWVAPVLPTASAIEDLLEGSVRGWVNILTTTTPVGDAQGLLVLPLVSGLVSGALSMSIARRSGRGFLLALAGPIAVLVAAIVVGIDRPAWLLQAVAFAVVALLWGSARQRTARSAGLPVKRRSRVFATAAILLLAAGIGQAVGSSSLVVDETSRRVVRREVEPPMDLRDVPSPLEGFRRYRSEERADEVIFEVTGLSEGDRLRLATLDHYDGVVWHVKGGDRSRSSSSLFQRVGEAIPVTTDGQRRSITVEVGSYGSPWVPSLGAVERIEFGGGRARQLSEGFRYNLATDTAAETAGLRPGDRFELSMVVPSGDVQSGSPDRAIPTPRGFFQVEMVKQQASKLLLDFGGGASQLEQARHIEKVLRGDVPKATRHGYFSDGLVDEGQVASRPGHSAERMRVLLDPEHDMVGNEEQYASAMALLARELGFPSRVVVGFEPKDIAKTTEVRGRDISAWTEVAVAGAGWVPLYPTPKDTEPLEQAPRVVPPPDRLVPPPPKKAVEAAQPRSGAGSCRTDCDDDTDEPTLAGIAVPRWVRTAGLVTGPPLFVLGAITAAMAGLKRRRRKKRRSLGSPAHRIAAGWQEVCDLAVDLGDVVPWLSTRRELAVILARPGLAPLAQTADAVIFGPEAVTEAAAAAYWSEVNIARAAMLGPFSRFARWKALVNPSSLRFRVPRPSLPSVDLSRLPARLRPNAGMVR
ncbi:MAG: hypothetical protein JWM47_2096 [Acidimicrobiales bacterium]|nr:hypothetical protein [Acidimicrobiales bacterium]